MPIFPTQYSTLSSTALKDHLQIAYKLEILTCKYLLRGVNDHYLIETKEEKYIFRVYRNIHRSFEEIQSELFFLNSLRAGGISVSYPINSVNNEQILNFEAAEGIRHGVLFSYAKGESISLLDDKQLTNFGKELARIHNISVVIKLPFERKVYDVNTTIVEPSKKLKLIFEKNAQLTEWMNDAVDKVVNKLNSFDSANFSYGYCHYDLLPKNFHFDDKDQITFFDFDFLGKGQLVNDIMTFWIHLSLNATFKKISQEEADRCFNLFISSYREIRQLSDEEIVAIPYLSFGFWIFFMNYHVEHFDDFSNPFFNPRYIAERLNLIETLTNSYCRF